MEDRVINRISYSIDVLRAHLAANEKAKIYVEQQFDKLIEAEDRELFWRTTIAAMNAYFMAAFFHNREIQAKYEITFQKYGEEYFDKFHDDENMIIRIDAFLKDVLHSGCIRQGEKGQ